MKDFWEQRYSESGFAYGHEPNAFLVENRSLLTPSESVLVVGDGEGRNGVWLAEQGMQVTTVDYSQAGVAKSKALAAERGVQLNAECHDMTVWNWPENAFDFVVSIFLHFSSDIRPLMHKKMLAALKPGGTLIMEAFNKRQLQYKSGGPPVEDMLFSEAILKEDFAEAEIVQLGETNTILKEGPYHDGEGAVVRLIAKKR